MGRAFLIAMLVASTWCPVAAAADGFTGWEKMITHVTAAGEPEIAVGPHGTPLLVAFNSCGIAVSRDR